MTLKVLWAFRVGIPKSQLGLDVVVPEEFTIEGIRKHIKDADILVVGRRPRDVKITSEIIKEAPKLKLIQNLGDLLTPDMIDVEAAKQAGITVAILPNYIQESVAEHTMMFLLALSRNLIHQHQAVANAEYVRLNLTPEKTSQHQYSHHWGDLVDYFGLVYGKTLGIVGMGVIGRKLATRASSFGLKILYYDIYRPSREEEKKLQIEYRPLDELLAESDFVSLHVPHTPQTEKMIGKRELSLMKPTAFLINCARGGEIDQTALCEALQNKRIAGAALDVGNYEPIAKDDSLLTLDNVIFTPHIAGHTQRVYVWQRAYENILRFMKGEKIKYVI